MKILLKILMPMLAILAAVGVSWWLVQQKPVIERKPVVKKEPLVSVIKAQNETLSVPVFTRGTVTPGTQIQLVAEASGQVLSLSENFANGGFFRKGEQLIKIDTLEHDVKVKRAEANVAQAGQALVQAKAERRARRSSGSRSQLGKFEIQVKQAEASYAAAKSELQAVKLQRTRTQIKAPFDGRVRQKLVNVGQYVAPGTQLGVIYAVDAAEVRLPLSDRQLGLVNVPLDFASRDKNGPPVVLVGQYGGKEYQWPGKIVRSESGLDERNRLLYVVAQVDDPYEKDPEQPDRPPLTSGFFVEAKIQGKTHENLFTIPRQALRNGNQVWLVNDSSELERRDIEVLYKGKDSIYVKSGLENGDRVVVSQLDIAVDGMRVRTNTPRSERPERPVDKNLLDATPESAANVPAPPPETMPESEPEPEPQEDLAQKPSPDQDQENNAMSPLAAVIDADMAKNTKSDKPATRTSRSGITTVTSPRRLEEAPR